HLRQEVPYSVAVIVDQFKERNEDLTYISANIFVERATQKGIILGHKGAMIKSIGRDARREIQELLGTRVYLELWVKVRKKWRKKEKELRRMGYSLSH
ncbi:MAG: KH domain-containing protein, partial [Anaerolineae bacterium]